MVLEDEKKESPQILVEYVYKDQRSRTIVSH